MDEEYTGEEYTEELEQDYTDKDMQVVTQLAYMNFVLWKISGYMVL